MDMVKKAVVRTLREKEGALATTLRNAARVLPTQLGKLAEDHETLRRAFDADYYLRKNPDLSEETATLEHYLRHGWHEGRDPSAEFSTTYYLSANPDVGDAGTNPFLHWLKFGRSEGRFSARAGAPEMPSDTKDSLPTQLQLGVVSMVRNERDIIASFADHLLHFFDRIVFIDHNSEDGTREYLEELARFSDRVTVLRLDEPGYIQSLATTHVVADHDGFDAVDWIFFLDADEFLPFNARQDLHETLAHFSDSAVISMRWSNLVPETYWEGELDFADGVPVVEMPGHSPFLKIAFQPTLIDRKSVEIKQGNHALSRLRNGVEEPATDAGFPIHHLPLRSMRQVELKLRQGTRSYAALGDSRNKDQGNHWFRLAEALQGCDDPIGLLNAAIINYGERKPLKPKTTDAIVAEGGVRRQLHVALQPTGLDRELLNRPDVTLALPESTDAESTMPTRLVTTKSGALIAAPDAEAVSYTTLEPSGRVEDEPRGEHERLAMFLRPTYWDIEELTPTAWGGHVPFLFALVTAAQPRRYVELGSHYGASFFSYCRAARRSELKTEAVAIDAWKGDEHAGSYDERVFSAFCHILRKYSDVGSFLRMYFEDAARHFAAGSIDLLHIDGLHTYEAVRQDYETWLPKMSDRGIIMFHDVAVHERDFGVWKFWEEIEAKHPTIIFRHSHGLGVAYVGEEGKNPIAWLFDLFSRDAGARHFLQQHLEEVAPRAVELFRRRHAMGEGEHGLKAAAALGEEVTKLRQSLATTESENVDLRKLLAEKAGRQ